jgi:hypothetical protein
VGTTRASDRASYERTLREIASSHPGVVEDVACRGTALESSAYKVGKKSFLFLGPKDLRLKLAESLPSARKLAAKHPDRIRVGALGWVQVRVGSGEALPKEQLANWIAESYRLMAGFRQPEAKRSTGPAKGRAR